MYTLYNLESYLEGKSYKELLDLAFEICDEFILVRRYDMDFDESALRIIELLAPFLIEEKKSSNWPGTTLLEQTADIYSYRTNPQAKKILLDTAQNLYSWVQPGLPEDLCFCKNKEPWLVNTAHEKQCIFENLSTDDLSRLQEVCGLKITRL